MECPSNAQRLRASRRSARHKPEGLCRPRGFDSRHLDQIKNRKGTVKQSTYDREALVVRETEEVLGNTKLKELDPSRLETLYARTRQAGRLSENELFLVHGLIRRVLNKAVKHGIIQRNPALLVENAPRPHAKHRSSLSIQEAARFREVLLRQDVNPNVVATLLLLETGCRRGEVLGLTWENVDLDRRRVRVRQQLTGTNEITTPKSLSSRRNVAITNETADYLATWRETQMALSATASWAWWMSSTR